MDRREFFYTTSNNAGFDFLVYKTKRKKKIGMLSNTCHWSGVVENIEFYLIWKHNKI